MSLVDIGDRVDLSSPAVKRRIERLERDVDVEGAQESEKNDFDYASDFKQIYPPLEGGRTFTRGLS